MERYASCSRRAALQGQLCMHWKASQGVLLPHDDQCWTPAQAAFVRVHQDFTANVLRGGKPHIVKNVKEEIERDLSLDEFRYWTAVVRAWLLSRSCSAIPYPEYRITYLETP